jgi:ribosomal protein S18 acetylase RimI-like enzyme
LQRWSPTTAPKVDEWPVGAEHWCEADMSLDAMRVARPTSDLGRIRSFYEDVVGLRLLWSFTDHDGFDGAIFGLPDQTAQLELVRSPHGDVPAPSNEDALVLYGAGHAGVELIDRLRRAGTVEIAADDPTLSPHWPRRGARSFVDPDGYRLVVVSSAGQHPEELVSATSVRIVPAGPERDAYLPLVHLADDSVDRVRGYYQSGTLFALDAADGTPTGMILAIPDGEATVELRAVAVDTSLHGRGVGTRLLLAVLEQLRAGGVRRVVVGTSSSGIGQLAYYQKAGFRLWKIERDFFSPAGGYPEGVGENGIPVRDMVWMDLELEPVAQ